MLFRFIRPPARIFSSFRAVLIRYAERGLVVKGRPNLGLFNQLYLVLFSVFGVIAIILFPVLKFTQGNFDKTIAGKICLLVPLKTDSVGIKHCIMGFSPVCLGTIFKMYFNRKVCQGEIICTKKGVKRN